MPGIDIMEEVIKYPVLRVLVAVLFVLVVFLKVISSVRSRRRVRVAYMKMLGKMFEYGQKQIEKKERKKRKKFRVDEDEEGQTDAMKKRTSSLIDCTSKLLNPEGSESEKPALDKQESLTESLAETWSDSDSGEENGASAPKKFHLEDCLDYIRVGIATVIEDDITKIFTVEETETWNLLSRTNHGYGFINPILTLIWFIGVIFRYFFLLPLRFTTFFAGLGSLIVSMSLMGLIPECGPRRKLIRTGFMMSFKLMGAGTSIVHLHDTENRPKYNSICVANHTTPIDVQILATDNLYSLSGQLQGGLVGIIQRAVCRASPHIWFDRADVKDRQGVMDLLKQHTTKENAPPVILFPEGVCVNNTSVMQFKKGCFEIGVPIYPIAMKYEREYGDAFWYQDNFFWHLFDVFSSWALVCHIYYMAPMKREEDETAIDFAKRVQSAIAEKAGFSSYQWDGYIKTDVRHIDKFKKKEMEDFSKKIC